LELIIFRGDPATHTTPTPKSGDHDPLTTGLTPFFRCWRNISWK